MWNLWQRHQNEKNPKQVNTTTGKTSTKINFSTLSRDITNNKLINF